MRRDTPIISNGYLMQFLREADGHKYKYIPLPIPSPGDPIYDATAYLLVYPGAQDTPERFKLDREQLRAVHALASAVRQNYRRASRSAFR